MVCRSMVWLVVLVGMHEIKGSSSFPALGLLAELAPKKTISSLVNRVPFLGKEKLILYLKSDEAHSTCWC